MAKQLVLPMACVLRVVPYQVCALVVCVVVVEEVAMLIVMVFDHPNHPKSSSNVVNTGTLIKSYRASKMDQQPGLQRLAHWVANNFSSISWVSRWGLSGVRFAADSLVGSSVVEKISWMLADRTGSGKRHWLPKWISSMPGGAPPFQVQSSPTHGKAIVYFPSCSNRIFGAAAGQPMALHQRMRAVMQKAGFQAISPPNVHSMCCGLAFESHGFPRQASEKAQELLGALRATSNNGQLPIVCDMSQCCQFLAQEQHTNTNTTAKRLKILEPVGLTNQVLAEHLDFQQLDKTVVLHVPCSSKKMGCAPGMTALASKCATNVVDSEVPCCGMAGDRGLLYPELPRSSLKSLLPLTVFGLPKGSIGVSSSRTCEMALTHETVLSFTSIMDLVDEATRAKCTPETSTQTHATSHTHSPRTP
jgi:D-lactate dehydrogenase